MNKQFLSLDFYKYHFSKLKRKFDIFYTKIITFIYKRRLPEELLSIMKNNRTYLRGIDEYLTEGEYDDRNNNYGIQNERFLYSNYTIDEKHVDILVNHPWKNRKR